MALAATLLASCIMSPKRAVVAMEEAVAQHKPFVVEIVGVEPLYELGSRIVVEVHYRLPECLKIQIVVDTNPLLFLGDAKLTNANAIVLTRGKGQAAIIARSIAGLRQSGDTGIRRNATALAEYLDDPSAPIPARNQWSFIVNHRG